MGRREFIRLLSGATATWPLAARAQLRDRMRRIGMLMHMAESDAEAHSWITAFRKQLESSGWTEGRNIQFDIRWGAGDLDRLRTYAAELVRLTPDVAFAESAPANRVELRHDPSTGTGREPGGPRRAAIRHRPVTRLC